MAYRMVIVDDQPKELEGIGGVINWQALEICVTGKLSSAGAAIAFVEQNPVDIVLTDVVMPDMDGFHMIERLKSVKPELRFIVTSCVDTKAFYARAMFLRVDAYILKPILASEITEAARKVIDALSAERESADKRRLAKAMDAYAQEKAGQGALIDLICLRPLDPDVLKAYRAINFTLPRASVYAACLVAGAFTGSVRGVPWARAVSLSPDETCLVIACDLSPEAARSAAETALSPLAKTFPVGVGAFVSLPEQLGQSYQIARADARARLWDTRPDPPVIGGPETELDRIQTAKNRPDMLLCLSSILQSARESPRYRVIEDAADEICISAMERLLTVSDRQAALTIVKNALNALKERAAAFASDNADAVNRMLSYIRASYAEDIGLAQVSESAGFSVNYAGSLFKAVTGKTIRAYIEEVRLEKALARARENPDIKVAELAKAVGYVSVSYFLKVFKKRYGCTPAARLRAERAKGAKEGS